MDIIELKWWLMEKKVELMNKRDIPKYRRLSTLQNYINGELEIVNELLEMLKDVSIKTEKWNGIHAQVIAPNGTFEKIFNEAKDETDI